MPTYTFRNKKTGREWTDMMKIAEMEELLAQDPNVQQVPGNPFYGDPHLQGRRKPPEGFRDVLKEIKRKTKSAFIKNTVNTF